MNLDSAVFYSNDIEKVTKFYIEVIGLKMEEGQSEKFVSFIFPNGARLGIKKASEEREVPGHQTVFISCDKIDEKYKGLKEAGVEFYKDLETLPWGRTFRILDPDKNKVQFVTYG